jgi:hypothetical protein
MKNLQICPTLKSFEWRPLKWNPRYLISETGEVLRNGKLLKQETLGKKPYKRVALYGDEKKPIRVLVHRLVYECFVGELQNGLVVDHIDNNPENNHFKNLQQVSYLVNSSKDSVGKTSKFPGVWKEKNRWRASIGKRKLGSFIHEHEAIQARKMAEQHFEII